MNNRAHQRVACGRAGLVLLGGLAGALVSGCDRDAAETTAPPTPTTENVAESPMQYLGKKLTLTGEVDAVYGDRAFELEGNEAFFDSSLLVLTRSPVRLAGQMVRDDDRVSVTGTVRNFVVADLERDLDWDLTPELEVEWRNKPALVADSISSLAEQARWAEKDTEREGVLLGLVSMFYVPDPKALSGQKIELDGVPVQEVMGDGVWVGANHSGRVFVAGAESKKLPKLQRGDRVDVVGTIREMPDAKQAIQRWGLQPKIATEIDEEVVYIEAQTAKKSEDASGGTAQSKQTPPR